jgi:hypothetical protein
VGLPLLLGEHDHVRLHHPVRVLLTQTAEVASWRVIRWDAVPLLEDKELLR